MKQLDWNEEFYIRFELDGKSFCTPSGRGFVTRFEVESEKRRLISRGASHVVIAVRKWS